MDHNDCKELVNWLAAELSGAKGVVVGFSGSYSSAVGLSLLRKAFDGPIDPVFVCAKDEVWRMDLAEEWLARLNFSTGLRKLILNETIDDLEDQIPSLRESRDRLSTSHVQWGLEMVAASLKYSILWLGDRNAALTNGVPVSKIPHVAPLANLSYPEVRQLGSILSVSDAWLDTWHGIPSGQYVSDRSQYEQFDSLVGVVCAHKEDIEDLIGEEDWEESVIGGGKGSFRWLGWAPDDTYDRVTLAEILSNSRVSKRAPAKRVGTSDRTHILSTNYTLSLSTKFPEDMPLLGSVRVIAETAVDSCRLHFSAYDVEGRRVSFAVRAPKEKTCVKLMKKFEKEGRLRLPIRLTDGDEGESFLLSLSEEAVKSFSIALEDVLSYISILPDEIVDRKLTEEEIASKERLASAPRPGSRR